MTNYDYGGYWGLMPWGGAAHVVAVDSQAATDRSADVTTAASRGADVTTGTRTADITTSDREV